MCIWKIYFKIYVSKQTLFQIFQLGWYIGKIKIRFSFVEKNNVFYVCNHCSLSVISGSEGIFSSFFCLLLCSNLHSNLEYVNNNVKKDSKLDMSTDSRKGIY